MRCSSVELATWTFLELDGAAGNMSRDTALGRAAKTWIYSILTTPTYGDLGAVVHFPMRHLCGISPTTRRTRIASASVDLG